MALQEDLRALERWERDWLMEFHPDKCKVINIAKNKTHETCNYHLHGLTLETVTSANYLGMTISKDLKWDEHISKTTKSANTTLAFLRRNIRTSNQEIKSMAYNTLVRPKLEYASTVWDPYTQKSIRDVEMVQRRAARWVTGRYHNTSSVTEMLNTLGWASLETRRRQARLIMMYKIIHDLVAIHHNLTPMTRSSRNYNSHSFIQLQTYNMAQRCSYFPRTVIEWNALPEGVVSAPSLETFKARLSRQSLP